MGNRELLTEKAERYAADTVLQMAQALPALTVSDALKVQIAIKTAFMRGINTGIDHFSDCMLGKS